MAHCSLSICCLLQSAFVILFTLSKSAAFTDTIHNDSPYEGHHRTKGHHFAFAFMDNCLRDHEDVIRGPKVIITVPTDANATVIVNVTMPRMEFFETVVIDSGNQGVVQLPHTAIPHGSGLLNHGVTVEASEDVFVYGLAMEDRHSRSEGFQALPVPMASASGQVEYAVVSLKQKKGNTRRYAQFVAVGVADVTRLSIELTAEATFQGVTYQAGDVLNVNLTKHVVLLIKSLEDLTGTKVIANIPIGLLSGVNCGAMKLRQSVKSGCGHMIEQLPPVNAWGRFFIYYPLLGGPSSRQRKHQGDDPVKDVITKLKIVTFEEDTDFLIATGGGRLESNLPEIDISGTDMVQITSFKPILVVAFVLYHGACDKSCKKRTPTMTVVPPLVARAPEIIFATLNATDRNERSDMTHYLSIMYDCGCFRRITWEHNTNDVVAQVGFAAINNRVCWTQYEIPPGQYHITSGPYENLESCFHSAYLFGHGTNGAYGFPIGLDGEEFDSQAEAPSPPTAAGSEFFMAFAAQFKSSRKGPRLVIYRASAAEDTVPIQGSVNSGLFSDTFNIPVGEQKVEVVLPLDVILENNRDERRYPVEVRSWGQVVVYGINDAFSDDRMDSFLALPVTMMGREYFIAGASTSSSQSPQRFNMFIIIGLSDDTVISLNLKAPLFFRNQVHQGGTTVQFLLNRRQTLYFISIEDQSGTRILASKPISVMSGATCGLSPNPDDVVPDSEARCGHMLEYLPPVERWGRKFVVSAFRGYEGMETTVYIVAAHKNTTVAVNGEQSTVLSAGDVRNVYLSKSRGVHAFIEADKAVLVYQVSNSRPLDLTSGRSFPSLTLIPSMDETDNDGVGRSPLQENYIPLFNLKIRRNKNDTVSFVNIVTRCFMTSSIVLNGNSLPTAAWSEPIHGSQYCVLTKRLDNEVNYQLQTNGTRASVITYGFSPIAGYSSPGIL